jgi:hypothetical protein
MNIINVGLPSEDGQDLSMFPNESLLTSSVLVQSTF